MISAIIMLLAVLTAGSILGTFIIAVLELDAIDDIRDSLAEPQDALHQSLP